MKKIDESTVEIDVAPVIRQPRQVTLDGLIAERKTQVLVSDNAIQKIAELDAQIIEAKALGVKERKDIQIEPIVADQEALTDNLISQ